MNNNLVYGVSALKEKPDLNVSMTLRLNVLLGRNRISRATQTLNVFYGGTSTNSQSIELDAAAKHPVTGIVTPATWTSQTARGFNAISLYTSAPLRVEVFTDNTSYHVDVKKLWVCDSLITKIILKNLNYQEKAQFSVETLS